MRERTTLEIIAPTADAALAQSLSQLGLTADAVSVDVLDSGTKGLFGLGGRQVRVRISVNPPPGQEKPVSPPAPKPASAKKTDSRPKVRDAKPRPEVKPAERPAPSARIENHDHDPLLDKTEEI